MNQTQRPLSPHLQIYRPQITSVLSILHRFTGAFLTSAPLVLVIWLTALAAGESFYETLLTFFQGMPGKFYFFVLNYCFFYHLCNGLRHLAWDAGYGFDLDVVHKSGWIVVVSSAALSLITWFLI